MRVFLFPFHSFAFPVFRPFRNLLSVFLPKRISRPNKNRCSSFLFNIDTVSRLKQGDKGFYASDPPRSGNVFFCFLTPTNPASHTPAQRCFLPSSSALFRHFSTSTGLIFLLATRFRPCCSTDLYSDFSQAERNPFVNNREFHRKSRAVIHISTGIEGVIHKNTAKTGFRLCTMPQRPLLRKVPLRQTAQPPCVLFPLLCFLQKILFFDKLFHVKQVFVSCVWILLKHSAQCHAAIANHLGAGPFCAVFGRKTPPPAQNFSIHF